MSQSAIPQRKTEHVELALKPESQMSEPSGVCTGSFDDWWFAPLALPEQGFAQVKASTQILSKGLSFSFLISSMTGAGPYCLTWFLSGGLVRV